MKNGDRQSSASSFILPPSSFPPDWLLWQLLDSAFPTGGFAHSGGIEAAWQHGLIRDGEGLLGVVAACVRQAARSAAPVALAVVREPDRFEAVDAYYDVTVTNHVANRAGRAQGRALLAAAAATFGTPVLVAAADAARRKKVPCHLPPAFGLAAAAVGLDPPTVARGMLFSTVRGVVSAAVRLGVVGPMEGQRVQASVAALVESAVAVALATPLEEIAQTAPVLDLLQGTQDRLYSRLFQS